MKTLEPITKGKTMATRKKNDAIHLGGPKDGVLIEILLGNEHLSLIHDATAAGFGDDPGYTLNFILRCFMFEQWCRERRLKQAAATELPVKIAKRAAKKRKP